ncbi:hypothetical protein MIND_00269700 [Mycena indigotica]|uniref:Uncharacterized protein n=1 Tax=Mycena indigotica TaxID=2126181 RepID=A0A8H6WC82_9AGAR|nr:uncharacterized protein MIND_00269700 [Mycena indigotica]KAF7312557.1 hypothetical protein MIND_00269700 [Mycena indigotica]
MGSHMSTPAARPVQEWEAPTITISFQDSPSFAAYEWEIPDHARGFPPLPSGVTSLHVAADAVYRTYVGDRRRLRCSVEHVRGWGRKPSNEAEALYVHARSTTTDDGFFLRLLPNAEHSTQDRALESFSRYEKLVADAAGVLVPRHHGIWIMDTGKWAGIVLFSVLQWCGVPFTDFVRARADTESIRVRVGRVFELLHDFGVVHRGTDDLLEKVIFDMPHYEATQVLRCYIVDFSEAEAGHVCARRLPAVPLGAFVPSRTFGCREMAGLTCCLDFNAHPDTNEDVPPYHYPSRIAS